MSLYPRRSRASAVDITRVLPYVSSFLNVFVGCYGTFAAHIWCALMTPKFFAPLIK